MDNSKMNSEDIIVMHLYRNHSHLEDRRLPFAVCCEGIGTTEGISTARVSAGVRNLIHSGLIILRNVTWKRNAALVEHIH
jgi:hypothetical protein